MYFNKQQKPREDILFKETDKKKSKEEEKNSLLNKMWNSLSRAERLYSTLDELKQKQKEIESKTTEQIENKRKNPVFSIGNKIQDAKDVLSSNESNQRTNKFNIENDKLGSGAYTKDGKLVLKGSVSMDELNKSDQNFQTSMGTVFEHEGGFSDDPDDKGGRTNMGITQSTYNDYCKRHGLKTKDVKNLTKNEAVEVYYNDYWKVSGADKFDNQTEALIMFDTAVLHGVGKAKQFYKQSGGDFDKFLQLRKEHYEKKVQNDPSQKKFLNGWNNRVNRLEKKYKESKTEND